MTQARMRAFWSLVASMLVTSAALAGVPAAALATEGSGTALGGVTVTAERLGIGGGGALFDPAIRPFNANDMAVGTDTGGLYVARDGGASWARIASGTDPDPDLVAVVRAAAEAAVAYGAEQGFASPALKDAIEAKLESSLCYSVDEGVYHVLYEGGYYAFTVASGKVVSAGVVDKADRLPVFDTLADAEAGLATVSSGFLTCGLASVGDGGHGYYELVGALASGQPGIIVRTRSFALTSAEGAVNPYQLGYTDDTASVNAAIDAFHASAFHTLVFPEGDYRLVEDIDSQHDDRAYYGLGATLYTDGAVALRSRNAGHGSLWVIRGSVGWSQGDAYVNDKGETKKKDVYHYVSGVELNGLTLERRTGSAGYNRMVSVRSARGVTLRRCTFDGITKDDAKPASGGVTSTNGAIVDFYGDYDDVKFLNSTIVGEAAIDIRDLCDHVGNIPATAQADDGYPTGGRNVVVRGNDITTYNFDEGLPIFAGNEQGLGTWTDGVFTEYPTLSHCLVENVLVENNAYTMREPATTKQRVVAITCGYQDSPVRGAVIRNNTFDVCANSFLIMFGYAENCTFEGNDVTLRRSSAGTIHELVHRSDHTRTQPTKGVLVGGNTIAVAGEDATLSRTVGNSLGPDAVTFSGNDVTVAGTVERVFDSTATQTGNTFHLNYVKHLYDRVGEVAHNTYDINELGNLYESYGTDATTDLYIHDERATIAKLASKYLLTFNGTSSYNGHSLTFANCVYDAATFPEEIRVAYSTASSANNSIVDDLALAFVGCEISGCTSARNYAIVRDSGGKVALSVANPSYGSASVAAMCANTALAAGDVVRTRAYHEGGPADGGGTYDIVSAPLVADAVTSRQPGAALASVLGLATAAGDAGALVDDGGSHIKLDNGLWAVLRVTDKTVNVHQFGARGDGMTDGTAATANANKATATDDAERLAAAMAYAGANPGTTVYFPAGTYCVSRGIEVPAHTTLTGAHRTTDAVPAPAVVAEGGSATLGMYAGGVMRAKAQDQEANTELLATITPLDPTTHAASLVSLGGADDVAVDHLVIDAGRSIQAVVDALPGYAINNYDWTDPAMPYRGYFTALTFGGNKGVKVSDCVVRNNVSMGCQFNGGENVTFERCDFLSVDVGIQEQGAGLVKDVLIRDCHFEGHDWSEPVAFGPTYAGDATGIWIERNTMRGIKYAHAIVLGERTQAYVAHTTFKDVHINDNVAHDMATFIGVSLADGLEMRDNVGHDAGQSYLYSCKNVTVEGLEMRGCARHGLLVGQECEDVSVTGLLVEDYDQDGGGAPGIDLSGTAKNVSLAGTVASSLDHGGPGLNLSGSGYDVSGLQFSLDSANYFDVMVHEGGTGSTLHVGPSVAAGLGIAEDAYRVPRVYVAEAVSRANDFAFDYAWPVRDRGTTTDAGAREQFSGMRKTDAGTFETLTTLPTGHGRYYQAIAVQAWDGEEDGAGNLTASYMETAQDGFVRTLSMLTAGDLHLKNGDPSRAGAIVWAPERTLSASGDAYELTLTCQDGVWYEQGTGAQDNAFASLAALREATDLSAGQIVRTEAYRAGSSRGGARYLVCDAVTAAGLVGRATASLADDGGRLVELSGTPGLWAVLAGVEVDAYAFGAYGDGEHDDAEVLQALLSSGLEGARLSAGTYLVGTPLVATAAITVEGAGPDASRLVASDALAASADAALLTVRDVEGFSISGVGFVGRPADGVGEDATGSLDLLRVENGTRTQVTACTLGPATGDGIVVTGSTRTIVSGCAISGVATGIRVGGAAAGADDAIAIDGNTVSDVTTDGIAFAADGSTYRGRVAISGNTVTGAPAGAGILLARANRYELVEIGSNAVSDCSVGIRVGGIAGTLDATDANPRRITSNTVRDATYGIILERSSGVALILNEVYDVQRTGLYLDTLVDCCTIWGWVTRYGLDAAGTADGLSDGCAIECVGEAEDVTLGGWVQGNHHLAEYAATRGRTACRVDGSGWDLSGLSFFCTMQEADGRPTVTLAAGAANNAFRTQYDAIVLDASGTGTNVVEKAVDDVRLVLWNDRAEPARVQAVANPTDPRADLAHVHELAHVPAVEATCETDGHAAYWACDVCGRWFIDVEVTAEIADHASVASAATGHAWGEPTYVWGEDGHACTALRICKNDAGHTQSETADVEGGTVTGTVTKRPTRDAPGETTYTATFGNAAFATQVKTVTDIDPVGSVVYVATDGDDDNPGTLDAPFATIAHAASVMRAGDTCYVRGGVYRERLSDHNRKVGSTEAAEVPTIPKLKGTAEAPFTFQAYEGERVVLTGCEPVASWTRHADSGAGSIWWAPMDWDMYLGKELGSGGALPSGQEDGIANGNLVFAQGKPCIEGRWPNVYADAPATVACGIPDSIMDLGRYAKTDAGTGSAGSGLRIVDDSLATAASTSALPAGTDLTGAQLWCAGGEAYGSLVYLINSHDMQTGTLTFDKVKWGNASAPSYTDPRADNIYYVTNSLALVDQPGEWYKDVKNKRLYLCVGPNENPNDMLIEAKQRAYAIDFGESSYVTFRGINVYGGIVGFMGNANHCTFTQAEVQATDACQGPTSYSSQWMRANGYGNALGVDLGGTFNAVTRCDFHDMFGEAVRVTESDNLVVNNRVRRANIENSSGSGGIQLSGKRHTVSHNTVSLVARLALGGGYQACEICYNDLSYAMRLSRDGGIIYCNACDYGGSELHHNVLHDSKEGEGNRPAFYLDPLVENLTFHHNVVYGAEDDVFDNTWMPAINARAGVQKKTLTLSPFGIHLVIANNTFVNTQPISITQWDKDPTPDYGGSLLANNLFRSAIVENYTCDLQRLGWTCANNLGGTEGPRADSSGKSGDFTFYFRTGDFADATAHNYTLAAGSEAIDGGIEIPGITDGYTGAAPDVGAFESSQAAWSAGCDLTRDVALEGSSVGTVPMSNVLVNGMFESYETFGPKGTRHPWEATTDDVQLSGWTQEGSVTHYHSSAWNYYGEIVGDGIYCVQMRSGSKLSQTVKGLKPNTLYAVAGYGRVASDYILGNEAVAGWDKNGNALSSVRPQSGIGSARTLQFGSVDFGAAGADQLIVGLSGGALGPTSEDLVVRVRLDDRARGPIAGELLCDRWNAYGGRHEWLTVAFDEMVTGKHDVFLEFDTSLLEQEKAEGKNKNPDKIGNGSLYGLFFANSQVDDAVTISAAAAGAGTATLVCQESRYTRPQRHAYVRTGTVGTIDVEVAKTGAADSALVGYVDTLSLYEVLPELDEVRLPDERLLERVADQLDAQGVAYLREGGVLQMAGNDIARVTSLDLSGAGIGSLEGIGSFALLERVDVSGNHIADFSPLEAMEGLEVVGKDGQAPALVQVRVAGIRAKDKTYDGTTDAELDLSGATFAAVGGGTIADELSVTAAGAFVDANAGEGKTVAVTNLALVDDRGVYALAADGQQDSAMATIAPQEVGLAWGDVSFTYDGEPHAPTATATGLVGDDACAVTVSVAAAGDVPLAGGAAVGAGTYAATATGLSNPNYRLPATGVARAFTIDKAAPTMVTAPAALPLTYTGEAQVLAGAGEVAGGTLEWRLGGEGDFAAGQAPAAIDAGAYDVWWRVTGDANHSDLGPERIGAAIAPAGTLVVSLTGAAFAYDGDPHALAPATSSAAGGTTTYRYAVRVGEGEPCWVDDVTELAVTDVADSRVIDVEATNPNYANVARASATLAVTPRALTVAAGDATVTYGDAVPEGQGVTYDGLVAADRDGDAPRAGVLGGTLALDLHGYSVGSPAGTYPITPGGLAAANYDVAFADGTLTVVPRTAELAWEGGSLAYDGTPKSISATVANRVGSDDVTVVLDGATATHAGAYLATATRLAGASAASYALPVDVGARTHAWAIARAQTNEVRVGILGWTYGASANDPVVTADFGAGTATFSYADAEGGQWLDDVLTTAGTHWVRATVPGTPDYVGGTATASFEVAKAPVSLGVSVVGWVAGSYDAVANAPRVTGNAGGGEVALEYRSATAGTWLPWAGMGGVPVGSYVVRATVAATDNHLGGSATAAFEVTPAVGTATNVTAERAAGNWGRADLESGDGELAAAVGVGDGDEAEVWVVTTDDVDDADRAAAIQAAGGYTAAHAFNARLLMSVGGRVSELHELASPVSVSVDLPMGIPAIGPGTVRFWAVVRLHDGEASLLPAAYDAATGRLTFATDRFSTYAVAYRDVPAAGTDAGGAQDVTAPPASSATSAASTAGGVVRPSVAPASGTLAQTGDPHDRRRAMGLALAGASALVAGLALWGRRRRMAS